MDLNELLFHQQVALIGASEAAQSGRPEGRARLRERAARLRNLRDALSVEPYGYAAAPSALT